MWIYDIIAQSGLLNRQKENSSSFRKDHSGVQESELFKLDILSFKNKNVITSGDFFPTTEEAFKEKLGRAKVNLMPQMNSETEILICGKYPDWMLVEAAKKNGLKIIFVDKVSDLFSETSVDNTEKAANSHVFSSQVPLGV